MEDIGGEDETSGGIVATCAFSLGIVGMWAVAKVDAFAVLGMPISGLYRSCIKDTDPFGDGVLGGEYEQRVAPSLAWSGTRERGVLSGEG